MSHFNMKCSICHEEECKESYHQDKLHYCRICDMFLQSNIAYCEMCKPPNLPYWFGKRVIMSPTNSTHNGNRIMKIKLKKLYD